MYDDLCEVTDYLSRSPYGQQASVFTQDARCAAPLIDVLANVVCRININTQCTRMPDTLPFTGRRSSALGTMSVKAALEEFSVEAVLAARDEGVNTKVLEQLQSECRFLQGLGSETGSEGKTGGTQQQQGRPEMQKQQQGIQGQKQQSVWGQQSQKMK